MSRYRMILLAWALSLASGTAAATPSERDIAREVLVLVRDDAIQVTERIKEVSPADVRIEDKQLAELIRSPNVRAVARACPETEPEEAKHWMSSSRTNEGFDLTRLFRISLHDGRGRGELIAGLRSHPGVILVEANQQAVFRSPPNDPDFRLQWNLQNVGQGAGVPGADIDALQGWEIGTGSGLNRVGIVDLGVYPDHDDLAGRVTGQTGQSDHATEIAGIIGAYANNSTGITGIDWQAPIISSLMNFGDIPATAQAIRFAVDSGAGVINASWGFSGHSYILADAIAYAYKHNVLVCVAMPEPLALGDYPSKYRELGVINVGATDNRDGAASYTIPSSLIDVAAPGGSRQPGAYENILSTESPNGYAEASGTSRAAAHVTGVASVLRGRALVFELPFTGNDARGIIKANVDDLGSSGFDNLTGHGRINLRRTVGNFGVGGWLYLGQAEVGGTDMSQSTFYPVYIFNTPGLEDNQYSVRLHEVQRVVPSSGADFVWGLGSTTGWPGVDPALPESERSLFNTGWCEPVPGTLTQSSVTLRSYVYEVFTQLGQPRGWYPCQPSQVVFQYRLYSPNVPGSPSTALSAIDSYFVPEAGDDIQSPVTGANAVQLFRVCPNNDGGTSLPNKARIRIVAKDGQGMGIPGIEPEEIFILFNGGPSVQGFPGAGADSIVANHRYNPGANCPDVRMINADGPTDASGVTYLTFTGSGGLRDGSRKWGHYDTEVPVYVRGVKLDGRLTVVDAKGSYVLRIKNYDHTGGLGTALNQGEVVTSSDLNAIANNIGDTGPLSYWRDFDSSGGVAASDFNQISQHVTHDCGTPNQD